MTSTNGIGRPCIGQPVQVWAGLTQATGSKIQDLVAKHRISLARVLAALIEVGLGHSPEADLATDLGPTTKYWGRVSEDVRRDIQAIVRGNKPTGTGRVVAALIEVGLVHLDEVRFPTSSRNQPPSTSGRTSAKRAQLVTPSRGHRASTRNQMELPLANSA